MPDPVKRRSYIDVTKMLTDLLLAVQIAERAMEGNTMPSSIKKVLRSIKKDAEQWERMMSPP